MRPHWRVSSRPHRATGRTPNRRVRYCWAAISRSSSSRRRSSSSRRSASTFAASVGVGGTVSSPAQATGSAQLSRMAPPARTSGRPGRARHRTGRRCQAPTGRDSHAPTVCWSRSEPASTVGRCPARPQFHRRACSPRTVCRTQHADVPRVQGKQQFAHAGDRIEPALERPGAGPGPDSRPAGTPRSASQRRH